MDHSSPISEERLLVELEWVRRIARQLVHDAGLAEDVVQETWLLARERPPLTGEVRSLRRWLARVARSVAIRILRGERLRAWREREASTSERCDDSPPELLERATTHQRLVAAVLALEDPYRSAVLMRFVDGLALEEVAQRQGISRENARQRVSRGLARVRARLERESGHERDWMRMLVALCSAKTRSIPWKETILMGTTAKWLASLTLASLGWWLWTSGRDERSAGLARMDHPASQASALGHGPSRETTDTRAGREPVSLERSLPGATEATDARAVHVFRARILDRAGRPLTGAELRLPIRPDVEPARSSARGEVELAVAGALPLVLPETTWIEAPGNAPGAEGGPKEPGTRGAHGVLVVVSAVGFGSVERFVELGDERHHELGELRLIPLGTITGRLLGPDLEPLSAHPVRLAQPSAGVDRLPERRLSGPLAFQAETLSDDAGRFTFTDAPEGLWRAWAGGDGFLWTCGPLLRVTRDLAPDEFDLVLERTRPGDELRGRVLRPDGTPSVGTRVSAVPSDDPTNSFWRNTLTDDGGRFTLKATPGLAYDVKAHGRGFSGQPLDAPRACTLRRITAGVAELELRLQEPRVLEVLVSDRKQRAVTEFELFAPGEGIFSLWHREVRDELGRGRVEIPDHPFRLLVRAEGYAPADLGLFTPEDAPRSLEVTLERLARVRGHVRGNGRTLEGAVVELVRLADGHSIDVLEGFPSRWDRGAYCRTESDAQGAFELPIPGSGRFALCARREGLAPRELGPFELDPRHDERIDFELDLGGALAGRVLVPPGQDPAGVEVRIGHGDGTTLRSTTDARGHYRFERLMPGRYMAEASYTRTEQRGGGFEPIETIVSEEEFEFPWVLEVFAGETTEHDLDLATQDVARLEGTLRIDGRAHGLATIRVLPGHLPWNDLDSPRMTEVGLEAGGGFAFENLRSGPAWLVLGLGGAPLDGLVVVRRIVLERGVNRTAIEIASAGLGGPRPSGPTALTLLARLDDDTFALLALEEEAPFLHLPGVPAAESAWLVEPGAGPDPFSWERRAEFTLLAGEWTSLE